MSTIQVQLPGDLAQFVEGRIALGNFADAGDYIVALVDAARRGQSSVESLLIDGLQSGPAEPWTAEEFEASRQRLVERHGKN
jgi:Arc/MetJ-type ribon-helix-helix transcriptional regulator